MEKKQKEIGEIHLPLEIIQHIQSFMDEREAARTTLLSKSWFGAWLTRPILDLDEFYFRKRMDEFPDLTKKTMQRYEDRNIKINTFRLQMYEYEDHSLPSQLILKAIKLGAHNLEICYTKSFVLPDEVFQSRTLTSLYVSFCTIGRERIIIRKKEVITFSNLKSLDLSCVDVNGDLFGDLISRCPSIEELRLEGLWNSLLETSLTLDVGMLVKLHKLKRLRLEDLEMGDGLFRSDLWPKFSCLKELEIAEPIFSKYERRVVRICSTSLERITICSFGSVNVEFDVPNIKMFEFGGDHLPHLKTSSRKWEAYAEINCSLCSNVSALWFSSLNQLAKMLGQSRVSLHVFLWCDQGGGDGYVGDGLAIPALENLTITGSYTMSPAFLDALFCSCRPNLVSIQRQCVFGFERANVEEFRHLRSLPWEELIVASLGPKKFVSFQLK